MSDNNWVAGFSTEFFKQAEEVYNKDFYDWMGHSVEYSYALVEWLNENIHRVPEDKRTWCIFTLGGHAERHYWDRRKEDPRDPDLWLPAGYHGSAHTCIIEGRDPDECKICKKQVEYAERMKMSDEPRKMYWDMWDLKPGRRIMRGSKHNPEDKTGVGEFLGFEEGGLRIKFDEEDESTLCSSMFYVFQPEDRPAWVRVKFDKDWFVFQIKPDGFRMGGVDFDKLKEFEEHHGKTQGW